MKKLGIAALYAAATPEELGAFDATQSWVYWIRSTPNFIDVRETLGVYAVDLFNQEFAALGGFRWEQVLGWIELQTSTAMQDQLKDYGRSAAIKLERFIQTKEFFHNADYNPTYDRGKTSGAVPQLAGFPEGHLAWERFPWHQYADLAEYTLEQRTSAFMESIKAGVRWRGEFPLFERVDLSTKALAKVIRASEAAKQASAAALGEEKMIVAAHKAMKAEQESARAQVWLKRLARVFSDHSFLTFEAFFQAESCWLKGRDAAAKSHWRGQLLVMKDYRKQASDLMAQAQQLDGETQEERDKKVKTADVMPKLVNHLLKQVDFGLDLHAQEIASLKTALNPSPEASRRSWPKLIWVQFRESQSEAISRELQALQSEHAVLQASADEMSFLAQEAKADAAAFLAAAIQSTFIPEGAATADEQETDVLSFIEILVDVVAEVISLIPTPAAPALQVLKWGRRGWKALKLARRVQRISKTMNSPMNSPVDSPTHQPQRSQHANNMKKLRESSAQLEKLLENTKASITDKSGTSNRKSMNEIFHDADSISYAQLESLNSESVDDLLQKLDAIQVPTEMPPLVQANRPLEDLLQELDRIEVPQFDPEGAEDTSVRPPSRTALEPVAVVARTDTSVPGGTDAKSAPTPKLEQDGSIDLVLHRLDGLVERQVFMRKWSALDDVNLSHN